MVSLWVEPWLKECHSSPLADIFPKTLIQLVAQYASITEKHLFLLQEAQQFLRRGYDIPRFDLTTPEEEVEFSVHFTRNDISARHQKELETRNAQLFGQCLLAFLARC